MSEAVLFSTTQENPDLWVPQLRRLAPDMDLRLWPDVGSPEEVEYAIVARPEKGDLARYPNLKAVFSMWAGVEDLLAEPSIRHIPIIRMVEPGLTAGIVAYVVHHVTGIYNQTSYYNSREWKHPFHSNFTVPQSTCVGILGLGHLGIPCANALVHLNFQVIGFSSSRKSVPQVQSYCGSDDLPEFLSRSQILVSILPRTPQTENFINAKTLSALPPNAHLINCGRGETVCDEDLLEFVRNGHIAGAVLDVFRKEPLPPDHPFWDEPNITVSPHCASKPDPVSASEVILQKMEQFKRGEAVDGTVVRERAY